MSLVCCDSVGTGTGKTMSVICSALQWVVDRRRQQESGGVCGKDEANDGALCSDDEPDWMRNFVVNTNQQIKEDKVKIKKDKKIGSLLGNPDNNINNKKKKGKEKVKDSCKDSPIKKGCESLQKKIDTEDVSDKEFLLEEYESEDEDDPGSVMSKRKAIKSIFTSSSEDESDDGNEEEEVEKEFKVYFCSRTHSQLSQFIKELRRTVFASEMDVVSLGSRKNLCINEGLEFT